MNKELLVLTRRNLMAWLGKADQQTVPPEQILKVIMLSLADMCSALAYDTEDEREAAEARIMGTEDD
jgi:hypothetical protein